MVGRDEADERGAAALQGQRLISDLEDILKTADELGFHLVGAHLNQALIEAQRACDRADR